MRNFNHKKIERKWQKFWERTGIYQVSDRARGKQNFYHLVMFPYPSGDLHIGHWYNFAPADVYARFQKMRGLNVMSPIGFDGFGLPAENAALKRGIHPKTWTYKNIIKMRKQLKSIGTIYDWSREVVTCDPEYYKWTQWMFLQFYKKGLVYRAKVYSNWCPSCKTVLANEQVVDGKCERCDAEVFQKEIEQWLFKISDYAERLLRDIENLDWPETTKIMQKNWIGRSEGWEITFNLEPSSPDVKSIKVFTTRADTLFGCTYLVIAPEHPLIQNSGAQISNLESVKEYIKKSRRKTERERLSDIREKTGIRIKGLEAINPVNKRQIPIFVADYVLGSYGTGAIMAVPAHDQRDFDFAKKYNLPIIEVIKPSEPKEFFPKRAPLVISNDLNKEAYEGEGFLVNSARFNGMPSSIAKERIGEWLAVRGLAEKKIYYRLRDWLVSRQRYWGCPIPMIFCSKCGWVPVKQKDLPVVLPRIKDFKPTREGKSPLAKSKSFTEIVCPKCGCLARRETDTLDTFVDSSWYYLRYTDPHNQVRFAGRGKLKKWLPVNMYIGGTEHAVLHLLYSRFFTKVLKDLGYLSFEEPFLSLHHQGIILGPDGQKMSKSRGNVIDPDIQVEKYGSDVVRMYLCFMGPYEQGGSWKSEGMIGISRFLNKVWSLFQKSKFEKGGEKGDEQIERLLHRTIRKVTEDIEEFKFNTAISALMILVNSLGAANKFLNKSWLRTLLLLLAPFAPHFSEELWSVLEKSGQVSRKSIFLEEWPKYNSKLAEEEIITLVIQVNGKIRDKIEVGSDILEEEAKKLVLEREKIKKWVGEKEIKKLIFVPGKLINIVI